jgi:hypothetical protein
LYFWCLAKLCNLKSFPYLVHDQTFRAHFIRYSKHHQQLSIPPNVTMNQPRQSAAQRNNIAIANRISKKYRRTVFRLNTAPRGLINLRNDCYRNATLQTLTHLPRFVNWILDHGIPGRHWPCNPQDPNRGQTQPVNDAISNLMCPHYVGCTVCFEEVLSAILGPSTA